jgi:hypothetical protein
LIVEVTGGSLMRSLVMENNNKKVEFLHNKIKWMIENYCNLIGCKDCAREGIGNGCVTEYEDELRKIEFAEFEKSSQ